MYKLKIFGEDANFIKDFEQNGETFIVYEINGIQNFVEKSEIVNENKEFFNEPIKPVVTRGISDRMPLENLVIPALRLNKETMYSILLLLRDYLYSERQIESGYKFNIKLDAIPVKKEDISISDIVFETIDDCEEVKQCLTLNRII